MRTFKDNAGRQWLLEINVGVLKQVRSLLHVDLMKLDDSEFVAKLVDDPVFLVDLIWVLISDQAEKQGVTDEQFGRSLGGDAIAAATEAMIGAMIDFFPGRRRQLLAKTWAKALALEAQAMDRAEQQIEAMDLDALMKMSGPTPGS